MNKKICVVGAGSWGKNHIRTLHELGLLGGIVESDKELLNNLSVKYPQVYIYQDIDEALHNDILLGFTVATPAETHHFIAEKIIKIYN